MRRAFLAGLCAFVATLPAVSQSKTPRPAMPLEISMPDGTKHTLAQYAGKVCVVEFLFTTCPHCQESAKVLSRLNFQFSSKGFQALGAAFNDNAMMLIPEFVRNFNVNYPVGVAPREKTIEFLGYNMMSRLMVPQIAFIDRKGIIRYQSSLDGNEHLHDEKRMREIIEELLKEPAPAKKTVSFHKK
ncbi:MAG TPA: TlpA disulfide reductase family protein [Bryobacteraceae bacterium]|nr:TlpA disulfide reductase family protein [Bryobacteraceae bacterium]